MTNDPRPVPDGAYTAGTVRDLQGLTVDSWKEKIARETLGPFFEARESGLQGWVKEIGKALAGNPAPGFEPIRDAQLDLNNRVDLLDEVRGYCAAYQSLNINAAWSFGDSRRRDLPFDKQIGPAKGAHVDAEKGGIVFESPGLWDVFALIHARKTGFPSGTGESDAVSMFVRLHKPNGTISSESVIDEYVSASSGSVVAPLSFVVPEAGYYVTVGCWTSRWRWWDGGTRYTRLVVKKIDSGVENQGTNTVPDETEG